MNKHHTLRFVNPLALCLSLIRGCGDSQGNFTPLLTHSISFFAALDDVQVVQGTSASGSATAELTLDLDDKGLVAILTLNGLTADSVTLKSGFAGATGTVLTTLQMDSDTQWSLPTDTVLDTADVDALNVGGLYLEVTNADGTLRGQIIPDGIEVCFNTLLGAEVVPAVSTTATATAATTINTGTESITVHINTLELLDATFVSIYQGLAGEIGTLIIDLTQDPLDWAHWSVENLSLTQSQYTVLRNEELYFRITTPAVTPEVRGQLRLSDGTQPTLSSIQDKILTPKCATSGCHKGRVPSEKLDLSLGKSFSELVTVNSVQVGMLLVAPGDAANSYLINKIDGTATVGGDMPVRGALLTPNQLDTIRQWIDAGALDN